MPYAVNNVNQNYGAFNNPYSTTTSNGNIYASGSNWHLNPNGRNPGFDFSKMGMSMMAPLAFNQMGFANEMEPIRQGMIKAFIQQNNPANQNYLIDASRRNALSSAQASQAQMGASGFYGGGYSDPSVAANMANEAGQNAFTQVHSPEYQAQLYQNVLGGVAQGQQIGAMDTMQALHGMNVSTPRNAPGGLGAIGSMLGQGIGMFTGGMGNNVMGGGGGGVNSSMYSSPIGPAPDPNIGMPGSNYMGGGMYSPNYSGFGQVNWGWH